MLSTQAGFHSPTLTLIPPVSYDPRFTPASDSITSSAPAATSDLAPIFFVLILSIAKINNFKNYFKCADDFNHVCKTGRAINAGC